MMQYSNTAEFKLKVSNKNKVKPIFTNKSSVHVAFVADDSFVDFLGVAINSIIVKASIRSYYDIIVITTSMSDNHILEVLSLTSNKNNIFIRFAFINDLIGMQNFIVSENYNQFTYYRLLLPDILEDFSKILYLDADVIVNRDIAELYNMSFDGKLIIGTYDTQVAAWQNYDSGMRSYFKGLGLENSGEYVQAGVLLFDIKNMVNKINFDSLIQKARTEKYLLNDQDLINIVFKGNIKIVSLNWNVLNRSATALSECLEKLKPNQKKEYEESMKKPFIIHFAERSFPCYKVGGKFDDLYWRCVDGTVFSERLHKLREEVYALVDNTESLSGETNERVKAEIALLSGAKQVLKHSKLIVYIYQSLKMLLNKPSITELTFKDINIDNVVNDNTNCIILKPGSELSCLHSMWSKGKYCVIINVIKKEKSIIVPYYIMSGCRHIILAKSNLKLGVNKLTCYLYEMYVDVELVLINSSNKDIVISKVFLEHG